MSQYPIQYESTIQDRFGDEFSDDGSFDGALDHAPPNSHGTFLEGLQDGVEDLEVYEAGGYHPIHLGDLLGDRYQVIHKLGHGGFSTVWLCRDTSKGRYVAVKVHTANISYDDLPDLRLINLDQSAPGACYINIPSDHFSISGPNGTHQCLVLTLLGPRASPNLWRQLETPGPILRKMCQQTTQALAFLHQNGICHGDFRPANILVKLANLDHLSEDEIISLLGQPEISHVGNDSGDDLPPSSPKYLVITTDLHRLGKEYLIDQICVIDFGESFQMSSPPTDLGIPENYLPPEVLLEHEHSIGPACDLWALGCTLFEIRRQLPLFYMIYDKDGLLAEMVSFFGKLPDPCWAEWEAKADFFEENGKRITMEGQEEEVYNLQTVLADKIETFENGSPSKLPEHTFSVPEDEQKLCAKLVLKLLSYTPGDRLSAKDAANDEWFKV